MKRQSLQSCVLLLLTGCLTYSLGSEVALAQDASNPPEASANETDKEWYYGPTATQAPQKSAGRQRAELRARQRSSRLEAMRWYGFSASRPTATGIPFTSMYSPAWTRPGGRPYGWYTSQRPVVIISPYYPRSRFR